MPVDAYCIPALRRGLAHIGNPNPGASMDNPTCPIGEDTTSLATSATLPNTLPIALVIPPNK